MRLQPHWQHRRPKTAQAREYDRRINIHHRRVPRIVHDAIRAKPEFHRCTALGTSANLNASRLAFIPKKPTCWK
jgi:hypothetical protein